MMRGPTNDRLFLPEGRKTEGATREVVFTFFLVLGFALTLTGITVPYRGVHIPFPVMVALGFLFTGYCLRLALEDFHKIMLLFAVYIPFQKELAGDFGGLLRAFNMTNILILTMALGWFSQSFLEGRSVYKRRSADLPVFLFMFLGSISLIRSEITRVDLDFLELVFVLKRWAEPMLVYYIFVNNIRDRRDVWWVVFVVCLMTGLVGMIGLKEYYIDIGGLWRYPSSLDRCRIKGIADQPNQFGAYFCYYSFYMVSFFFHYLYEKKFWIFLIPIAVCGRAMLLCFSRGATISFAVAAYATTWFWNRKVALLLLTPVLCYFVMNPDMIPSVIMGRLKPTVETVREYGPGNARETIGEMDASAYGRINLWYLGVQIVKRNPVFGVGFGNYPRVSQELAREGVEVPFGGLVTEQWDPHSTYVAIATEMGVPALILFLLILGIFAKSAWGICRGSHDRFFRSIAVGYLGGMVGLLVVNIFGSRLFDTNEVVTHFWIMSAVILCVRDMVDEEVAKSPASVNVTDSASSGRHAELGRNQLES
ncbi:MAG: O-antigen ligase family protein [Planctomycetota bacterium]